MVSASHKASERRIKNLHQHSSISTSSADAYLHPITRSRHREALHAGHICLNYRVPSCSVPPSCTAAVEAVLCCCQNAGMRDAANTQALSGRPSGAGMTGPRLIPDPSNSQGSGKDTEPITLITWEAHSTLPSPGGPLFIAAGSPP